MTTRTLASGQPLLPPELTEDEVIGERVHMLMFRGRKTQGWLGEVLGMTQAAVSRKLRGQRPWLASEVLAVSFALDVPVTDLMPAPGQQRPVPPDGPPPAPVPQSDPGGSTISGSNSGENAAPVIELRPSARRAPLPASVPA